MKIYSTSDAPQEIQPYSRMKPEKTCWIFEKIISKDSKRF